MALSLSDYFKRIQYSETATVDLSTLNSLQRQHLLSVPYENLDVQLGRSLDRNIKNTYDKIVVRGRGGWCYEMNGLLGWALEEIGFDVTYLSGGVGREARGDSALGNHLVILVKLNGQTWIVDAGFGDGFISPIELKEDQFSQRGFDMKLCKIENDYWRFHNHEFGGAPNFDFLPEPADPMLLDAKCQQLQVDPESPFVRALIMQKFTPHGYDIQVGLIAKSVTSTGVSTRKINSPEDLVERISTDFGVNDPEIATLWPKLEATHEALFSD